jgi:hypothetical protein
MRSNSLPLLAKRSLVGLFILCFAFTLTYVPQSHNQVKVAEAGGGALGGGQATQLWQQIQNIQLMGINVVSTITKAASWATAGAVQALVLKDTVLDGLFWTLARNTLSAMTRSLVRWINSGFRGSPMFVQNLEGFMFDVADRTFGEFIYELGGPFSMVCSPFRLDVRIALTLAYARARAPAHARCTLTGALRNIESFIAGNMHRGGWDAWLQMVARPQVFTPFGAALEAESQLNARLVNARGQEITLLNWGSGFMSNKICEWVGTPQGGREECFVATPGRVISDALTFQLSTGPRSLIEADEINEVIGALLNQIMLQAVSGVGGLLGLSAGTGYTNPAFNVDLHQPGMEIAVDPSQGRELIAEALAVEHELLTVIDWAIPRLSAYVSTFAQKQENASSSLAEAVALRPVVEANIIDLQGLLLLYDNVPTDAERHEIVIDFAQLRNLHSKEEVRGIRMRFELALQP